MCGLGAAVFTLLAMATCEHANARALAIIKGRKFINEVNILISLQQVEQRRAVVVFLMGKGAHVRQLLKFISTLLCQVLHIS